MAIIKTFLFLRVRLLKSIYLLFVFIFVGTSLMAQETPRTPRRGSRIIDDTTKQIYGPRTSLYYYEDDVFYNRSVVHPVDTVIRNFHRWNYVHRNSNLYQDLGNIGTAIRPVYYNVPKTIGVRSGFEVYDLYWDSERIKYYDTKSPYSNMDVVLGGKGRSTTKATFSRNINPRWNFGFTYRGFFIDKQVPERRGKGDRVTRAQYYNAYTAWHTKDSTYRILANFSRMFHRVTESGGAVLRPIDIEHADSATFPGYFEDNVSVALRSAESNDLRMNMHVFHQVQAGKALQAYHMLDRYRQTVKFFDRYPDDQAFFNYADTSIVSDTTHDIARNIVVRNEFGIKGNILKLFYNGYYAIRHYNMVYRYWHLHNIETPAKGDENYLGGRIELNLDSIGLVNGWIEFNDEGNYRFEGNIRSRWFDGSLQQMVYKPSFAQQAYIGVHNMWNQEFRNTESSQLAGNLHYRSRVLAVSPGATFTRLKNYIFFDETGVDTIQRMRPIQSGGNHVIFSPQLKLSLTFFRHFTFSNHVIYTSFIENADNAFRVPELFVNSQLSYANIHFNGNLDMHAGVDIHWHSSYYAPAYDPATRQFYNQDRFEVAAFPVVDIFLNAKVKRGRIFIKYNNLVQAITKIGYFPTPYYPGQRNIIDFGFDWSFYD